MMDYQKILQSLNKDIFNYNNDKLINYIGNNIISNNTVSIYGILNLLMFINDFNDIKLDINRDNFLEFSKEMEKSIEIYNVWFIKKNISINKKLLLDCQEWNMDNMEFSDVNNLINYGNSIIKEKTNGKILNYLDKTKVNEETDHLLLNTIYFRSNWINKFNDKKTNKKLFHGINKTRFEYMMNQKDNFDYFENDKCKSVILPYENKNIEMCLVLPNSEYDNLNCFWNMYKDITFYKNEKVILSIPKFKIDNEINSIEIFLKEAGYSSLNKAQLSDNIKHPYSMGQRVIIEVDENGSEATSITHMSFRNGISKDKIFNADRSFLWVIRDTKNKNILFMGIYK